MLGEQKAPMNISISEANGDLQKCAHSYLLISSKKFTPKIHRNPSLSLLLMIPRVVPYQLMATCKRPNSISNV